MTTTVEDLLIRLRDEDDLDGCAPAVAWLAARDGTLEQAWDACERGDWMLWLAEAAGVSNAVYIAVSDALHAQPAQPATAIAVRRHITGAMLVALLDAHAAAEAAATYEAEAEAEVVAYAASFEAEEDAQNGTPGSLT